VEVQQEFGSFDTYIWGFVNHQSIINHWKTNKDISANTPSQNGQSHRLVPS
jgi:DNA-3-methyladenine glycosylase I